MRRTGRALCALLWSGLLGLALSVAAPSHAVAADRSPRALFSASAAFAAAGAPALASPSAGRRDGWSHHPRRARALPLDLLPSPIVVTEEERALRQRRLDRFTIVWPVAAAGTAGLMWGLWAALRDPEEVWFEDQAGLVPFTLALVFSSLTAAGLVVRALLDRENRRHRENPAEPLARHARPRLDAGCGCLRF